MSWQFKNSVFSLLSSTHAHYCSVLGRKSSIFLSGRHFCSRRNSSRAATELSTRWVRVDKSAGALIRFSDLIKSDATLHWSVGNGNCSVHEKGIKTYYHEVCCDVFVLAFRQWIVATGAPKRIQDLFMDMCWARLTRFSFQCWCGWRHGLSHGDGDMDFEACCFTDWKIRPRQEIPLWLIVPMRAWQINVFC